LRNQQLFWSTQDLWVELIGPINVVAVTDSQIKSLKWWKKIFFWPVEVAVVNSFILSYTGKKERRRRL